MKSKIAKAKQDIEETRKLMASHPEEKEYCLDYIKETEAWITKKTKKLWEELGNIPVDNNDEIEEDFYHFPKGTPKEEIWHWFEDIDPTFSVGEQVNSQ